MSDSITGSTLVQDLSIDFYHGDFYFPHVHFHFLRLVTYLDDYKLQSHFFCLALDHIQDVSLCA